VWVYLVVIQGQYYSDKPNKTSLWEHLGTVAEENMSPTRRTVYVCVCVFCVMLNNSHLQLYLNV